MLCLSREAASVIPNIYAVIINWNTPSASLSIWFETYMLNTSLIIWRNSELPTIRREFNINILNLETSKLVYLVVGLLYLAGIIIIAGIDKERVSISKPVVLYEIVLLAIYMIYLYVVEKANMYRYVIYLLFI